MKSVPGSFVLWMVKVYNGGRAGLTVKRRKEVVVELFRKTERVHGLGEKEIE